MKILWIFLLFCQIMQAPFDPEEFFNDAPRKPRMQIDPEQQRREAEEFFNNQNQQRRVREQQPMQPVVFPAKPSQQTFEQPTQSKIDQPISIKDLKPNVDKKTLSWLDRFRQSDFNKNLSKNFNDLNQALSDRVNNFSNQAHDFFFKKYEKPESDFDLQSFSDAESSVGYQLDDQNIFDTDQEHILNSFESDFSDFESNEQAYAAMKKYLNDVFPIRDIGLQTEFEKMFLSELLTKLLNNNSLSSLNFQINMVKLLCDHGATVTVDHVDQALHRYENYVKNHNLDIQLGFLDKILIHKMQSLEEQEQEKSDRQRASKLAEIVFLLDDASGKNVVNFQQLQEIKKLESEYKNTWQHVQSWWKRTLK